MWLLDSELPTRISQERYFEKVSDADWLLVCSRPFSPFTPSGVEFWSEQPSLGKDRFVGGVREEPSEIGKSASQKIVDAGAGKWVLKEIDHDAFRNTLAIIANRSGTIANEGSVIFRRVRTGQIQAVL